MTIKPLSSDELSKVARRLAQRGWTVKDIATAMGRSGTTIRRYLKP